MTQQQAATLYIFSGLPGTGKSTLAKQLAKAQQAHWLRIDSIEQKLKDQGFQDFYDAGYQVAFAIARDNLQLGLSVVADSSNPIEHSRIAWREVAHSASCPYQEIEVICSDSQEHQHRIETRQPEVSNLKLPNWQDVTTRDYRPWQTPVIQIDTAGKTISQTFTELVEKLSKS